MMFVGLDIFLWEFYLSIPYTQTVCLVLAYRSWDQSGTSSEGKGAEGETNTAWNKNKNYWVWRKQASHIHWIMHIHRSYLIFSRYFWPLTHIYLSVCVFMHTRVGIFIYVYVCMYVCICLKQWGGLPKTVSYLFSLSFSDTAAQTLVALLVHILIIAHRGCYSLLLMSVDSSLALLLLIVQGTAVKIVCLGHCFSHGTLSSL